MKVVSLSEVIGNIASMLRRLTPETIDVTFEHAPALPLIYADVCNLEQIIVNLVVNARDAMRTGGTIAVRTDAAEVTAAQTARWQEARVGHFTRLTVTDTGEGMSKATLARIFEPFFTTKEVGKGTGMGLATVQGIVQQHEGWIEADSQPGQGTTFRIYLPATTRTGAAGAVPVAAPQREGANDVILLVEDDADVRALARSVLEDAGYRILEAADGHQAIAAWREFPDRIDLLLTDMVMPGGLSGSDVADRFSTDRPDGKILFSSGYSADLFRGQLTQHMGASYLPKPYLARQLTDAVAHALAGTTVPEAAAA